MDHSCLKLGFSIASRSFVPWNPINHMVMSTTVQFYKRKPEGTFNPFFLLLYLQLKSLWKQSFIEGPNNFCENLAKLSAQSPQLTTLSNKLKTFSLHD